MKVLYVEDYALAAALVRDALQRHAPEIELDIATSVAQALLHLDMARGSSSSAPPAWDVVLTDLNLPDGCGLDILHHLRAHGATTPVIVLTGSPDATLEQAALAAGACAVLDKQTGHLQRLVSALRDAART